MSPRGIAAALAAILLAMPCGAAAAERLVVSLSHHRVLVTSSFAGTEVVLFGSIERDPATPARRGYDAVVTVTGPRDTERVRRKERMFGVWVNAQARSFIDVPSYLYVLSDRPLEAIADNETRRRLQIGFDNFLLPQRIGTDIGDVVRDDPFRVAFLDLKQEHGLYREADNAVTLLTPTLFRADIPLPSNAPFGTYEVDIKLFADGALAARATTALEVIKVGFEQLVADTARDHGFWYGLALAFLALLTGWFASVVFSRD
ncbi:MAG TPA: TIGR02186 family protein [Xanthobacteraceae bacterium]|nr:TIGR02186 family protein [Xanthobacteraceae bacterium]